MTKVDEKVKIHLGQDTPRDQLYAGVGAIEGNLLNLEEGHCTPEQATKNIRLILRAMVLTIPHLEGIPWNSEKPKKEN